MCSIKCVKYLLFVFNFFFWLAGAGAIGIGIWTLVDAGSFDTFLGSFGYRVSSYMLIGGGAVVMLVGFLGCCGALKESKCMLGLFFAFLFIVFCVEVAAGILLFLYRDTKVNAEIESKVKEFIQEKYDTSGDTELDYNVNKLQEKLKCCGVDSYKDWENSEWYKAGDKKKKVPRSCCIKDANGATAANCTSSPDKDNAFIKGCKQALKDFVDNHMILIGSIGVAISCVQLLGMIFTCCLFCTIE